MAAQPKLTYVLDENLGGRLPEILRVASFPPVGRVVTLHDLGFPRGVGVGDPEWIKVLGEGTDHVVVTRDSAILDVALQREAWRRSGLRLMLLPGLWGRLKRPDLVRAVLYWWPMIVDYAEAGRPGTVWRVPHQVPHSSRHIRLFATTDRA